MDKQNLNDIYALERIRGRMRSGEAFTEADLISLTQGSESDGSLVRMTIQRFQQAGWIVRETDGAWLPTEAGLAVFAPAYEVPDVPDDDVAPMAGRDL